MTDERYAPIVDPHALRCHDCGALVFDRSIHDRFHRRLDLIDRDSRASISTAVEPKTRETDTSEYMTEDEIPFSSPH